MNKLTKVYVSLVSKELKVSNNIYIYSKCGAWDLSRKIGDYDIRDILMYYDCGFMNEQFNFRVLVTKVVDPYNYVMEFFPTNFIDNGSKSELKNGVKFITLNGEPIFILVKNIFNNEMTDVSLVNIYEHDIETKLNKCGYDRIDEKIDDKTIRIKDNKSDDFITLEYYYKNYLHKKADSICKNSGDKWKLLDSTIESDYLYNGVLNIYVKQQRDGTRDLLLDISRVKLDNSIYYYVTDRFDVDVVRLQKEIYEASKNYLQSYCDKCFSECMIVDFFYKHTNTYEKIGIDLRHDNIFNLIGRLFPYMIWDQDKILIVSNVYSKTRKEGPITIYIQGLRIKEKASNNCLIYMGDYSDKYVDVKSVRSYANELDIMYWKDNISLSTGVKGPIVNKKNISNNRGRFGDDYSNREIIKSNKVIQEAEAQGLSIDSTIFDCVCTYVDSLIIKNRDKSEESLTNQLAIASVTCDKESNIIDIKISDNVKYSIHSLKEANISIAVITVNDR